MSEKRRFRDGENEEWKVICNVEWKDGVAIVNEYSVDAI